MAANINRVVLVGNLTRDPEIRQTPSGTSVCSLRIAVFGNQAESCAQYLSKGRPVAIDGRLDWREWQTQDGQKREAVEIVAESVQFLGARGDGGGENQFVPAGATAGADADFAGADDDIPF